MNSKLLTVLFLTVLLSIACKKDPPSEPTPGVAGKFTAAVNGQEWKSNDHYATYYSGFGQLYLSARNSTDSLEAGVFFDRNNPLKKYLFEPNGENATYLLFQNTAHFSDHNIADAGGDLTVTKFDTVAGKLSGVLNFTSYSADRSKKVVFRSMEIIDLPMTTESFPAAGIVSATVSGTNTLNWRSNDIVTRLACNTVGKFIYQFEITPVTGGRPNSRMLKFFIPHGTLPGNYSLMQASPATTTCGSDKISVSLNLYGQNYSLVSGSLALTIVHPAFNSFSSNFTATFKGDVNNEIISFTNGQFNLSYLRLQ